MEHRSPPFTTVHRTMPLTVPNALAVGIAIGGAVATLALAPALRSTPQEAISSPAAAAVPSCRQLAADPPRRACGGR